MSNVNSPSAAAAQNKDGANVGASALTLVGWPLALEVAVDKQFLASGYPARITASHCFAIGGVLRALLDAKRKPAPKPPPEQLKKDRPS